MEDTVQSAIRDLCELIVKYDQHDRASTIKGATPVVSGNPINYNLVKGIDINDGTKSIGTIYKRLALITHPDKRGNEDDLTILNNAVEMLRNDPDAINQVLMKLMEIQTPSVGPTIGEPSATPRATGDDSFAWRSFKQRKAEQYASASKFGKRKTDVEPEVVSKNAKLDGNASLNFEAAMNNFIREYIQFFTLNPLNGETNGEIDPYFYAKNRIENAYPGVTVLPFDGDNEETFNANIKNYVKGVRGSQLPSFVGKFEVVKSYNVKRVATEEEKRGAIAQIDKKIEERRQVISAQPRTAYSSITKRPYKSSVVSSYRKGGSKTKRNRKQTKAKRNKSKRKRSRNTRHHR